MRTPRATVVLFPGSNCDHDAVHVLSEVAGFDARLVRHDERDLRDPDVVVLPGGFSYGDYLRSGAMARFSPAMETVAAFASSGRPVLGICNGFQVLCEAGLLPGALMRNAGLRFAHRDVVLRVETTRTPFTSGFSKGDRFRMPIAHGDGNWTAAPDVLRAMAAKDQIVFRYVDAAGERTPGANPNGSLDDVGGVCNESGNVVGLMPHPERNAEALLGNGDGARLFRSVFEHLVRSGAAAVGAAVSSSAA